MQRFFDVSIDRIESYALAVVVGMRHDDDLVPPLQQALRQRPNVHLHALKKRIHS